MSKSLSKPSGRDLPQPLKTFLYSITSLTAASWLITLLGRILQLNFPFPFPTTDIGGDFKDYQQLFEHLHSVEFFHTLGTTGIGYLYPAPLAIFYHLLFALWGPHHHSFLVLWGFIALSVFAAAVLLYSAMRRREIARWQAVIFCVVTVILSFPLQYEFLRGNVEVFVWMVLIAAIGAYRSDRLWIAGVLVGIAIACKWYPAVLLGFCFRRTKYKVIPIALTTSVLVAISADLWLGPTFKIAATETRRGMQTFLDMYAKHYVALDFDHSFFAFYKTFLMHHFRPTLEVALKYYMILAGSVAAVIYWVRIRKLAFVNQVVILLILSITLPPVSFDYTLLHLYTGWAIFTLYLLDRHIDGETVPAANWIMFWFAFAMVPHGYAISHEAQLRFLGLLALMYQFLKVPLFEPNENQLANSGV